MKPADQVGSYVEIEDTDTGFVWRGFLTHAELNRAWVGDRLFLPVVLATNEG